MNDYIFVVFFYSDEEPHFFRNVSIAREYALTRLKSEHPDTDMEKAYISLLKNYTIEDVCNIAVFIYEDDEFYNMIEMAENNN